MITRLTRKLFTAQHRWIAFLPQRKQLSNRDFQGIFQSFVITVRNSSLLEGSVFTSVCQEFCPQGGVYTLPRQTAPQVDTPPPRRPQQRTVRILLEYILVLFISCFWKSTNRQWKHSDGEEAPKSICLCRFNIFRLVDITCINKYCMSVFFLGLNLVIVARSQK